MCTFSLEFDLYFQGDDLSVGHINRGFSMRKVKFFFKMLVVFVVLNCSIYSQPCKVKNVILFIADGMGNQQRRLAAIIEGKGNPNHRLVMERLKTSGIALCHSSDKIVTDSAAAATALATGYRTNYKRVSISPDGKRLKTILEVCKERGKSCGLVTNTPITHATPACFASHIKLRYDQAAIASQYLSADVDVLLGGGKVYFLPWWMGGKRKDHRYLIPEFEKLGYKFVSDKESMERMNYLNTKKLLGLFSKKAMAYEIDRHATKEPSLLDMTKAAVQILKKNPKGFFLMVEGGTIDWVNHGHDVAACVYDVIMLDKAVKYALDFAKKEKNTLIVVVNDHETGGMAITRDVNPKVIMGIKASAQKLSIMIKQNKKNALQIFKKYTGITPTAKELKKIIAEAEGRLRLKDYWGYGLSVIAQILSKYTGISYATTGHSGAPIIIVAEGPGCEIFDGFYDIVDIPRKIAKLLHIPFPFPKNSLEK